MLGQYFDVGLIWEENPAADVLDSHCANSAQVWSYGRIHVHWEISLSTFRTADGYENLNALSDKYKRNYF